MVEKIYIVDFGSQYTQLIARRVRELNVYAEIVPFNRCPAPSGDVRGLILSGGPASVTQPDSPRFPIDAWVGHCPILGVCYGAQLMTQFFGGTVAPSATREYGKAHLQLSAQHRTPLFADVAQGSTVWMSHSDTITIPAPGLTVAAQTDSIPVAAFADDVRKLYGLQFHPEVTHTAAGKTILGNFLFGICGASANWTPASFIEQTVADIQAAAPDGHLVCGLSGGVDSSVAALLVDKAVGQRLTCIFVNNGLLRYNEYNEVLEQYKDLGLNIIGVDATDRFMSALKGVTDPEQKRKAIGRVFIEVFEAEANKLQDVRYLVQGTIYPDVIESVSVGGPSVTIKSHHNVGGLPERMKMKVVEPLRYLFKDEVRNVGRALGLDARILGRHPFPGPGLGIRVIGEVTADRVAILQKADNVFITALREFGLYDEVWQAFCVLLPVSTVGVMGDERTYENVLALRAVASTDGMTADWARLPHDFLAEVSNRIINTVKGVNRVAYDISSKPPATIEWE